MPPINLWPSVLPEPHESRPITKGIHDYLSNHPSPSADDAVIRTVAALAMAVEALENQLHLLAEATGFRLGTYDFDADIERLLGGD